MTRRFGFFWNEGTKYPIRVSELDPDRKIFRGLEPLRINRVFLLVISQCTSFRRAGTCCISSIITEKKVYIIIIIPKLINPIPSLSWKTTQTASQWYTPILMSLCTLSHTN